jgi:hypothetical protein
MATTLGEFEFISLTGPPMGLKRQLEVEARAGVDGHALWDVGKRGAPFNALSVVDLATLAAGKAEFRKYEELVGAAPVSVKWSDLAEEDFKIEVLDVRLVQLKKLVLGRGGVNNGQVLLRAEWHLLPIT